MDEKDQEILIETFKAINTLTQEDAAQKLSGQIIALEQKLQRALDALIVLEYYNRIHNDFEAYLLQVAEWGLGDRENIPNPDSFVSGLEPTEKLISRIRNARK